jgi:uncharacterized protein YegL
MGTEAFRAVEPENWETKCTCVLVLDVSVSMQGEPIRQLNAGLQQFYGDVRDNQDPSTPNRLEIGIVTFGGDVRVVQSPSLVSGFTMPTLTVSGSTPLVDGVREGIRVAEARKEWYRQTGLDYYRPYVIVVTDGAPDRGQDVDGLAREIVGGVNDKKFTFWAFGTEGADMKMLQSISHPSAPPREFRSTNFSEFFVWLSKSFAIITKSREGDQIDLTPANKLLFQHTV